MASHGVPRSSIPSERSAKSYERERQEIAKYKSLVDEVTRKAHKGDFSPELLSQTAALLNMNPEYYTMWNLRRRIYTNEFENLVESTKNNEIQLSSKDEQISQILQLDLQFLFPLLLKFPKCYWIWHHRLWLLQQSSIQLPSARARKIWEDELGLVGKMLARDNRNFHGWGYRRVVVNNLESKSLNGHSMVQAELDYTTKMIGVNLSNFSAWHNRSKVIVKLLDENSASPAERRAMLDSELELIHKALFDPYDQSLWFYHQTLLCTFDPTWNDRSIVPDLSTEECQAYLDREHDFIQEVLEDADDCKWAYQALISCAELEGKLAGGMSPKHKANVKTWISILKKLDPIRKGRWNDIEAALGSVDQ